MKKTSLVGNAAYSLIRNITSLAFPLITLSYVSNILGVENIGRYNFAYTFVGYFLLIAALGVSGYAIREGSRIRDDRNKVSTFLSEMFSINVIFTIISTALMIAIMLIFKNLKEYYSLILILGLMVVFSPFAITWLYTIFEDFRYITIRTIIIQIFSLIALVVCVKDTHDINTYALITVVSNAGSNIFNYIYSKKYCDIRFTLCIDWRRHFKPIIVIFITSLAISIYVSSDMTILGVLGTNYNVGIYSVSVKVYTLLKTGLVAVLSVAQARLAYYIGTNNDDNFNILSNNVINLVVLLVMPIMMGIVTLNQEIILLLSSRDFLAAGSSLCILMLAIFFNVFAQFFNTCVLMPHRREKAIFFISIVAAVFNIIANIIYIPIYKENAAAITTVLSEGIIFVAEIVLARQYLKIDKMLISNMISSIIGCVAIWVISRIIHMLNWGYAVTIIVTVLASVILYFLIQFLTKNIFLYKLLENAGV